MEALIYTQNRQMDGTDVGLMYQHPSRLIVRLRNWIISGSSAKRHGCSGPSDLISGW